MNTTYLARNIDSELESYLEAFGAILITGPKWCGKTTSASMKAKSILKLQDPDKSQGYLLTAQTKPSLLLEGDKPRLIDEWQMAPVLWDAIRTSVDDLRTEGLYILTGSTIVDESKIMHTGTGRIARLMMYPMSLFESKESNGSISLKQLFNDKNYNIDGLKSNLTIENLIFATCRGGWPSSLTKKTETAKLLVAKSYLDNIIQTDISAVDGKKREPLKVQYLLRSYARNIGTISSNKTIIDDVNSNTSLSESAYYEYINALNKLYVIEDIPAWNPSIRSKTSIRSSNKRMFIDPSIAAAALSVSPQMLSQDFQTFGFMFENLCIRDLKVYASSLGGNLSYYRDRMNLEVDAVLRLNDGRFALIEFKLGTKQIEEAAKHLLEVVDLIRKANETRSSHKLKEPDLLMIITGGEIAYTREDGIKIVPIGCLKH
ncbi:MAG: ATP-binding protein [Ignavibacteriales bacterium]|jgi:predicted AAA+ superfamily ATPase|nr:MAG: ATP-binding protein [Ignavibacteriales bacterium]